MKTNLFQRIFLQEDLNFLLTNRVPRLLLTRWMGWFSHLRSPLLTRWSIRVWRLFTELDLSDARKQHFASLHDCFTRELVPGADAKTLRDTLDKLKDKLKTAAIVLAAVDGDKVQLAAGVTSDTIGKVKAGELVNFVAQQVGGKGGGKPDMAMAGGTDATNLNAALTSVQAWVTERL
jgi:hypothetical protein